MRKIGGFILKILPFVIIGALIVVIVASGKEMSVETVLSFMPDNLFLAAVVLMIMYALKSLSLIFPILVLHVAAGMIFPVWTAMLLNIIGTGIAYTVPYIIGRASGASAADKLMEKYPKAREFIGVQKNSGWFLSFILRAVSCLPADIVSMYLGSIKTPYLTYITAGVAGTLPGLIPATVAGMSLMNPKSAAFIISVAATVIASLGSVLIYWSIKRRNANAALKSRRRKTL